jgi:hypothetical protein
MITPAVVNGKGFLPPGQAKAVLSFCGTHDVFTGRE